MDGVPVNVPRGHTVVANVIVIQCLPKLDDVKITSLQNHVFRVDPGGIALKLGLYRFSQDTFASGIRESHREPGKFTTSGDTDGMVLCGSAFIVSFLEPVGAFPGPVHNGLIEIGGKQVGPVIGGVPFVEADLVLDYHIFLSGQQVGALGQELLSVVTVIGNGGFSQFPLFGGNHDNPVGGAGTVDGCRCSVLQYVNGLDVVGVDVVQITPDHSVNYI